MDTKVKKHPILKTILIVLILAIAISNYIYKYNKNKLGDIVIGLYDRQNFAFAPHEISADKKYVPSDAVWYINDLADYEGIAGYQMDEVVEKELVSYYQKADNSFNWDNISTFLRDEKGDVTSADYVVFSRLMIKMSVEDLEKIIAISQIHSTDSSLFSFIKSKTYELSENCKHVAAAYAITAYNNMQIAMASYNYGDDECKKALNTETRAFAFLQAAIEVDNIPRMRGIIDITEEEYNNYTVQVKAVSNIIDDDHVDSFID